MKKQAKNSPKTSQVNMAIDKAKKDPVRIMASIIRQQRTLYKQEIDTWLAARQEAFNIYSPSRVMLTELYKSIELDAFIYGIVENKRILKISNKKFRLVGKDKKEDTEASLLINKQWFNDFVKLAMQSKFHGYSLVYFSDWGNGQITKTKLVYRDHVIPEWELVLKQVYTRGDKKGGFIYTEPPFCNYMIGIGNPEDLGLYEKAAPLYILKKHSWANWDEFEEIFGIPIRIAKTASQDPAVKAEMQKWLELMGSAAYGIFPADSELDIKESKQTDAYQVFNEKRKACNEELEILFTGQNRITQNGGSYAKEQVLMPKKH